MTALSVPTRTLIGLELFLSLGALAGGALLIAGPDGHLLGMTAAVLEHSPFTTFLVPGIVLFTVLGVAPLVAAWLSLRRVPGAAWAAMAIGVATIGWITVEMVMLAGPTTLAWVLYLLLGCGIVGVGARTFNAEAGTRSPRQR